MTDPVDFILDLQYENIPENAVESARLCILDAVGCMLGGMEITDSTRQHAEEMIQRAQGEVKKKKGTKKTAQRK